MSLLIKNLSASLDNREILHGVNLTIFPGKVHVLMGPNGSGKSTLAGALMGNPSYELRSNLSAGEAGNSELRIDKKDIKNLKPDQRAREGLFLAFQNPIAIPGVNVANLLKTAYQLTEKSRIKNKESRKDKKTLRAIHNPALSVWEFNEMLVKKAKELAIPPEFLRRSLNEQFSGGEKKKLEMLQAIILQPKYAIFDEIDTGLDVDALKVVAAGIARLKKQKTGILVITHYQRILKYIKPDFVHILVNGKIVDFGDFKLALKIERDGYKKWLKQQ